MKDEDLVLLAGVKGDEWRSDEVCYVCYVNLFG